MTPLEELFKLQQAQSQSSEQAKRRAAVLRARWDDMGLQEARKAAFMQRVAQACADVTAADGPFARLRFIETGVLERAVAGEREVDRVVSRTALARATLAVISEAEAAAAERCISLLREVCATQSGGGEDPLQRYAALRCIQRWCAIQAGAARAVEDVESAQASHRDAILAAEQRVAELAIAAENVTLE